VGEKMSRKPFVREVPPASWYFRHPRYMRYMAREVTCIFIGVYTMLLVWGIKLLSEGEAAYAAFLEALRSPLSIGFHVFALVFALYNTVTWFNVTPKALPVQIGEEFLPGGVITGAHYIVWAVLSLAAVFLAGVF
jgi:fumarate reductase subunit C